MSTASQSREHAEFAPPALHEVRPIISVTELDTAIERQYLEVEAMLATYSPTQLLRRANAPDDFARQTLNDPVDQKVAIAYNMFACEVDQLPEDKFTAAAKLDITKAGRPGFETRLQTSIAHQLFKKTTAEIHSHDGLSTEWLNVLSKYAPAEPEVLTSLVHRLFDNYLTAWARREKEQITTNFAEAFGWVGNNHNAVCVSKSAHGATIMPVGRHKLDLIIAEMQGQPLPMLGAGGAVLMRPERRKEAIEALAANAFENYEKLITTGEDQPVSLLQASRERARALKNQVSTSVARKALPVVMLTATAGTTVIRGFHGIPAAFAADTSPKTPIDSGTLIIANVSAPNTISADNVAQQARANMTVHVSTADGPDTIVANTSTSDNNANAAVVSAQTGDEGDVIAAINTTINGATTTAGLVDTAPVDILGASQLNNQKLTDALASGNADVAAQLLADGSSDSPGVADVAAESNAPKDSTVIDSTLQVVSSQLHKANAISGSIIKGVVSIEALTKAGMANPDILNALSPDQLATITGAHTDPAYAAAIAAKVPGQVAALKQDPALAQHTEAQINLLATMLASSETFSDSAFTSTHTDLNQITDTTGSSDTTITPTDVAPTPAASAPVSPPPAPVTAPTPPAASPSQPVPVITTPVATPAPVAPITLAPKPTAAPTHTTAPKPGPTHEATKPVSTFDISHYKGQYWPKNQLQMVDELQDVYKNAMVQAGLDPRLWTIMPTLQRRESEFDTINPNVVAAETPDDFDLVAPSNKQGEYQDYGKRGTYPEGPITYDEFVRETNDMATQIAIDYSKRDHSGQPMINADGSLNMKEIANMFFSYNGRAKVYFQQAQEMGFQDGYMGSPYVVNRIDAAHDANKNPNWLQYHYDLGGLGPADHEAGAIMLFQEIAAVDGQQMTNNLELPLPPVSTIVSTPPVVQPDPTKAPVHAQPPTTPPATTPPTTPPPVTPPSTAPPATTPPASNPPASSPPASTPPSSTPPSTAPGSSSDPTGDNTGTGDTVSATGTGTGNGTGNGTGTGQGNGTGSGSTGGGDTLPGTGTTGGNGTGSGTGGNTGTHSGNGTGNGTGTGSTSTGTPGNNTGTGSSSDPGTISGTVPDNSGDTIPANSGASPTTQPTTAPPATTDPGTATPTQSLPTSPAAPTAPPTGSSAGTGGGVGVPTQAPNPITTPKPPTSSAAPTQTKAPAPAPPTQNVDPQTKAIQQMRSSIVNIAIGEYNKHVTETPLNCDQGNPSTPGSCGYEIDKYTQNHLEYWCDDFASWVQIQAGMNISREPNVNLTEQRYQNTQKYYANTDSSYTPQPGDMVFMGARSNSGRPDHIGIIVKVNDDGSIVTVEGNTTMGDGTRNGHGVNEHVYYDYQNSQWINGFGQLVNVPAN